MDQIAAELRKLNDLKAATLVSDAEFDALKAKILAGSLKPTSSTEKELAEHFASETLRKHQTWRHQYEDFVLQETAFLDDDLATKQECFINMVKAGAVTPLERMLSFYSIYGTRAEQRFFQSLIATVADDKRVEYHNWYVARACGDAFLAQYGAQIAAGAPPLFPPDKEFGPFNVGLLKQAREAERGGREVTGAGAMRKGCFDSSEEVSFTGSKVIYAAGYAIPVDNGFVDIGIVEEAINWLDKRVKELETAMQAAQVQVPVPQQPRPPQSTYQNNGRGRGGQYNYNSYNSGYSNRGRGGRNRGGRGRYGQGNY
jgi:hypothetical protein